MKRIILLLILIAGFAKAQTPNPTYTDFTNRLQASRVFRLPKLDSPPALTSLDAGALNYFSLGKVGYFDGAAWRYLLSELVAQGLYTPLTRNLTINGVTYNLSQDRTWNIAMPELTWNNITGKPTFAPVAFSGAYADLTGKPTITTANLDQVTRAGFTTETGILFNGSGQAYGPDGFAIQGAYSLGYGQGALTFMKNGEEQSRLSIASDGNMYMSNSSGNVFSLLANDSDNPTSKAASFNGRVSGVSAINAKEFVTFDQLPSLNNYVNTTGAQSNILGAKQWIGTQYLLADLGSPGFGLVGIRGTNLNNTTYALNFTQSSDSNNETVYNGRLVFYNRRNSDNSQKGAVVITGGNLNGNYVQEFTNGSGKILTTATLLAGSGITITPSLSGLEDRLTIAATGGATGTVTSVAATVPTGLTVTGSPITTSGTLVFGLQSGYSIPTTANQTSWTDKQPALLGVGYPYFDGISTTPTWLTGTGSGYLRADGTISNFKSDVLNQTLSITPVNEAIATGMTITSAFNRTQGQINAKQNLITLTTTSTGAATFNQATGALNIPTPSTAYAPTTGATGYIQNQTATTQTAGYKISGTGTLDKVVATEVDNSLGFMTSSQLYLTASGFATPTSGISMSGGSGRLNFSGPTGSLGFIPPVNNTQTLITYRDLSGTAALLSDIPSPITNYVTTNTDQGSLNGYKNWLGYHLFSGDASFNGPTDIVDFTSGVLSAHRSSGPSMRLTYDGVRFRDQPGNVETLLKSSPLFNGIARTLTLPNANGTVAIGLDGSATLDFPSIPANSGSTLTFTVTGALENAVISLGLPANNPADVVYKTWVGTTNTVSIRAFNLTGSAIDPPIGSYKVVILNNSL